MIIEGNKQKASINFEIKTYEIDIAGHVNNIVYVKWLEDLRCKLFEKILPIDNLLYLNLYPVVTSTNIVYKKQLKLSDKPVGSIWIENIQHNMMILKFNFMMGKNICVFAEQKCVLMDIKNGTMDKERLKNLALFESMT
jgi:acyl-CoA thioester hydrolase